MRDLVDTRSLLLRNRRLANNLLRSLEQVEYITATTRAVQQGIGRVHSEGTCIAVANAAGTETLLTARALQGASPEELAILQALQHQYLALHGHIEGIASIRLIELIEQCEPDNSSCWLDWLLE